MAVTVLNSAAMAACIALSNGNLTATGTSRRFLFAIDFANKRCWAYTPYHGRWSGTTNNADPGTSSTGYDLSSLGTATMYPSVGGYAQATPMSYRIYGATSTIQIPIPAGYSAWDTIAGGTLVWDSAAKSANITLSESDVLATWNTTGGESSLRGTTGIALGSSNKAVFELEWVDNAPGQNGHLIGIANSSASTAQRPGLNANSAGLYAQGQWYCTGHSPDPDGSTNRLDHNSYEHFVRATNGLSSGKSVFEFTVTSAGTGTPTNGVHGAGIVTVDAPFYDSTSNQRAGPGGSAYGWEVADSGIIYNNSTTTGIDIGTVTTSNTYMFAVDLDNDKLWVWNPATSQWNGAVIGSQNPATNTGGVSLSSRAGATMYPAIAVENPGSIVTANFGASTFVNSTPTGFSTWDSSFQPSYKGIGLPPAYPIPAPDLINERHHRIQLARSVTLAMSGKTNNVIQTFTLNASTTTTILEHSLMTYYSAAVLIPMTASASTAVTWISDIGVATMTVAHDSSAATDRTFRVVVIG